MLHSTLSEHKKKQQNSLTKTAFPSYMFSLMIKVKAVLNSLKRKKENSCITIKGRVQRIRIKRQTTHGKT